MNDYYVPHNPISHFVVKFNEKHSENLDVKVNEKKIDNRKGLSLV